MSLFVLSYSLSNASKPCFESVCGDWARKTLQSLTLRQKIGQLFMVAAISCEDQKEEALAASLFKCPYRMDQSYIEYLIREYGVGGIIFLYKSMPEQQIDCTNHYQAISKIPLLIGQDCEWGLSMRLYDVIEFPRNNALGALFDKSLLYEFGLEVGKQCKAIGVHINFAPVIDVNTNPLNPVIGRRAFGDTPELVAECGLRVMQGLHDAGVLACAKHFPGHGDTSVDSHSDLPVINHSLTRLANVDLMPFKRLIDGGVSGVMSAHILVTALNEHENVPTSVSHRCVTQLLEHELGFKGLKITDGLGMGALMRYYQPGEIELRAFLAGNDILLCPLDVPKAVSLIEQAIHNGKISEHDLEKRILKILKAKEWAGCHRFTPINKQDARAALFAPHALKLQKRLFSGS